MTEANLRAGFRLPFGWQAASVHRRPWLVASGLFVLTAMVVIITMGRTLTVYDEGLILVGSERILTGDIPHRDFYANYGPGSFAITAGLFKLFGPYAIAARAWNVLVRAATVSIVYLLTSRASQLIGLAAALLCAYWMSVFEFYLYPQFPAVCACFASVALLRPTLEGETAPKRTVAAGIMAALPAMFQYDIGVGTVGVECLELAALALFLPAQRGRYRELLATVTAFLAGACLVLVPYCIWLVATGALPGFMLQVVTLALGGYGAMRRLPLPSLSDHSTWCCYQALVVVAACLPTLFLLASRRTGQLRRELALPIQVMILTLMFISRGWVRIDPIHMSGAILCSIVLMAVTLPRALTLGWMAKAPVLVAIAIALLVARPVVSRPLDAARQNLAWLRTSRSCQPQAGAERAICLQVPPEEAAASVLVRELTRPDEPVFVGNGRHDRIFVNNVLLYFLLERPVATAWHHMDPGVQTTAPVQRQMVDELRRKCVRVVVLDTEWDDRTEPNDSAISSGVTLLDDVIRQDYAAVQSFGKLTVMKVKQGVPRPNCP